MKKHLKTAAIVLLNILFCAIMLWLFTQNSVLRPYAGSFFKEALSVLFLLGSIYVNYFLLYPKIYQKYSYFIYWLSVVFIAVITSILDLTIAYSYIVSCNAQIIQLVGPYEFFSRIFLFIVGRNLALNFFPYLFRERQQLRHSLEKEREIVYERVRMLDVTDKDSNIHLIAIDDIFYCLQQGNFTTIYTVHNEKYTRLGSMKHLEQLFGEEDFIRITPTMMVPLRYIQSCKDNRVFMRKMPWEQEVAAFQLEPQTGKEVAERIAVFLREYRTGASGELSPQKLEGTSVKRKPTIPPEEKQQQVLAYIEAHPNCNSADIIGGTEYSQSTVERCLAELKKQGVIEYTGSKKRGGYKRM